MRGDIDDMTVIRPDDEGGTVRTILLTVRKQFEEVAREIEALRQRLHAGGDADPAELKKANAELRQVAQLYLKEASRFADELHRERGIAEGYALDLDAARREVECRMARLRAARGSGEVS